MFFNPYANIIANCFMTRQMNSYIRVFHSSPNAPAVDVYANDNLIAKNLSYKQMQQYLPIPIGNYQIKVYPTGEMTDPVISTNVYIPENIVYNLAVIGSLPDISMYTIPEPTVANNSGGPCIRFVHLSPNAPAVDVKLSDDTLVFNNVAYKDITNYACIPSGTYTFKVTPAGTDTEVLTIPDVTLDTNNLYTIYAIGQVGESPGLEALIVPEPR